MSSLVTRQWWPLAGTGICNRVLAPPCQMICTWHVRAVSSPPLPCTVTVTSVMTARMSSLRWALVVAGAWKMAGSKTGLCR